MKTNSSKNQAGRILGIVVAGVVLLLCCTSLWAQNLGWEGETGVFVTPLAYTAGVEGKIAEPVVGFHFLDAGPVIGQFYEASITVGLGKRFEVGYTSDMHVEGGNAELSPLWHNGFNIFNGKVNLLPENFKKQAWVPAVSVGFIARTQVHNVGRRDHEPEQVQRRHLPRSFQDHHPDQTNPHCDQRWRTRHERGAVGHEWQCAQLASPRIWRRGLRLQRSQGEHDHPGIGGGATAPASSVPAECQHSDDADLLCAIRADGEAKVELRFRDCASGRSDCSGSEPAGAVAGGSAGFVRILV